jgi:hypothetical protein
MRLRKLLSLIIYYPADLLRKHVQFKLSHFNLYESIWYSNTSANAGRNIMFTSDQFLGSICIFRWEYILFTTLYLSTRCCCSRCICQKKGNALLALLCN